MTVSVGLETFVEVAVLSNQCSEKNGIDLIIQIFFCIAYRISIFNFMYFEDMQHSKCLTSFSDAMSICLLPYRTLRCSFSACKSLFCVLTINFLCLSIFFSDIIPQTCYFLILHDDTCIILQTGS